MALLRGWALIGLGCGMRCVTSLRRLLRRGWIYWDPPTESDKTAVWPCLGRGGA